MISTTVLVAAPGEPPSAGLLLMGLLVAALAIVGWLCLYKTDTLVAQQRRRYEQHWWVRAYPFSSMVMKDWYPTYLRCSGLVIWLWDLALIYLVWIRKPVR